MPILHVRLSLELVLFLMYFMYIEVFFMEDKEKLEGQPVIEQEQQQMDATTYIEEINKLKASSVDKAEYEKVVAQNKELAKAVRNVELKAPSNEKESEEIRDQRIKKNRDILFGGDLEGKNLNNLEYAKAVVELRKDLIAKGEPDPFLPNGIPADELSISEANKTADALEQLVNESDSVEVFNAKLQNVLVDIPLPKKRSAFGI